MVARRWLFTVVALGIAMTLGCGDSGPPRVKFGGKITENGQPLKIPPGGLAQVVFLPQFDAPGKEGKPRDPATGMLLEDGSYRIIGLDSNGVYLGKYKVAVKVMRSLVPGDDALKGKFDEKNTPIEREVTASTTSIDIDLTKPNG